MIRMIKSSSSKFPPVIILLGAIFKPKYILSLKVVLLLLIFCFSPFSLANTSDGYLAGPYAGVRAGYSYNRNSCLSSAIKCDREDMGYGFIGGYEFGNQYAIEFSATKLGDTRAVYPDIKLTGELFTIDASLKYAHTLSNRMQIFGKVGAVYWDAKVTGWNDDISDSGFRPSVGAGVVMPLFSSVDVRLEYQYFDQLGNSLIGYTSPSFFSVSFLWFFSSEKRHSAAAIENNNYPVSHSFLKPENRPVFTQYFIDHYVESIITEVVGHEI